MKGPCSLWLFIILLLAGCSSLVQKGGEVLEGEAFTEKKTAVYRSEKKSENVVELKELISKDGEAPGNAALEITSSAWPGLALRGTLPGNDGRFELTGARVLSSHLNGWNEFSLEILGSAFFQAGNGSGFLCIDGEAERIQISQGRIRLKGNYLTGADALSSLRNRRERILTLTEWMLNNSNSDILNQKDFENHWKPILLPELVSKNKRPPNFQSEAADWRRADGVKWNLSYTEKLFPEELRELRNSGALLRDWEEALPWIFMEYSWETIIKSFNGKKLYKTK